MRKEKLVNFFKELGLYKEDVKLPVEVPNTGHNILVCWILLSNQIFKL